MRRILTAAVAVLAVGWALPAAAQDIEIEIEEEREDMVELGVTAGWPTGFSGKYWLNNRDAVQGGLAWNPTAEGLAITGDYLLHTRSLATEGAVELPVYAGIGGRVTQYTDGDDVLVVGPRVPIGVQALLTELPVSIFAEVAPTLEFGRGEPDIVADAAVGARLVF